MVSERLSFSEGTDFSAGGTDNKGGVVMEQSERFNMGVFGVNNSGFVLQLSQLFMEKFNGSLGH